MPAPPERRYELRAAAMFGSELSALGEHGEVFLEATVEHHRFTTRSVTCVDGYASFLALDPDPAHPPPGVFCSVNVNEPLTLPADMALLPDVFVYLCTAKVRPPQPR